MQEEKKLRLHHKNRISWKQYFIHKYNVETCCSLRTKSSLQPHLLHTHRNPSSYWFLSLTFRPHICESSVKQCWNLLHTTKQAPFAYEADALSTTPSHRADVRSPIYINNKLTPNVTDGPSQRHEKVIWY